MKLYITDKGDPSVGIWGQQWVVEVPFETDDFDAEDLQLNLEEFRKDMLKAYSEYSEGHICAQYDFELKAEIEYELMMELEMERLMKESV
mgnify:CR=1 FL=1